MNINHPLAQTGLYLLANHESKTNNQYVIVGGLAVQAYAQSQFKNLHRPTIDADIVKENITFKTFKQSTGDPIGKLAKNKFGIPHHIINSHNANTVQLMNHPHLEQKEVFLLHYTRYQKELYSRIADAIKKQIESATEIQLDKIVSKEAIETKAKIKDIPAYHIRVLEEKELLQRKLQRVISKKKREPEVVIEAEYEAIRNKIIHQGISYKPKGLSLELLQAKILLSSHENSTQYNIEKDIYDFCLLKRIFS